LKKYAKFFIIARKGIHVKLKIVNFGGVTVTSKITREACQAWDQEDPLKSFRACFQPPEKDVIFLDANSMGAMPKTVPPMLQKFCTDAWVELRRQGWNHFEWMERPTGLGASISHLMGARPEDVLVCDNTTVNLFKLLSYAWRVRGSGDELLTERGNFPTDLYVAEGIEKLFDGAVKLVVCDSRAEVLERISKKTAIVYLTHADYRSGERWDMADLNSRAHAADALTVWDLSHSTGAIPVDLMGSQADFAIGCGYKYLSGGPGGPAYLWVHPEHGQKAWPSICGWMGHGDVFAFAKTYWPLEGIGRQATGTPAVIANEIFACAAEIWEQVDAEQLWAKHRKLGDLMIDLLDQECGALGVVVNSPRDYDQRGGHIGFSHAGAGPLCEALLDAGVVGSFRKPNALRFGLGSLYLRYEDIWETVQRLRRILEAESWRDDRFQKVSV
jgi:kynureninase